MDEREHRIRVYLANQQRIKEETLQANSSLINEFIDFCAPNGIRLSADSFDSIDKIGIVAYYPNIVNILNSNIFPDKEELIPTTIIEQEYQKKGFNAGYFYAENYIVMGHPYFRRNHHLQNHFAPDFVQEFWRYNSPGNLKYFSIDLDRVRINMQPYSLMERDRWYSPKFNSSIEDIIDGVGKFRPNAALDKYEVRMFFNDVYSLDLKWATKGNLKTFYSEEFRMPEVMIEKAGIEYHPVKYIHAQYDLKQKTFIHLDGAIHFYTQEEYYQRRDWDLNYNNKNDFKHKPLSQKLFKINGKIEVSDWVNLVSHYLSGNPLIHEYFEGKLPDRIEEIITIMKKEKENGI